MARSSKSQSNSGQRAGSPERERMIAEAAYYCALNRGFQGGDPVDDWLTAEREIDQLSSGKSAQGSATEHH